jgi:glucose uptake protein GlcU
MNFEKIGQLIGTMLLLGSVLGWMRIDNWSMQPSIIMGVSGILIFWAGTSLEEKIQNRKHLKNLQREKEEAE